MPKEVRVDLTAGQVLRVYSPTNLRGGINSSKRTATLTASGTYVDPAADPVPTVIAGPTLSGITQTRVQVAWTVSEVATGQVEYRKPGAASKLSPLEASFDYQTHSQVVSGLTCGTIYELRVVGKDTAGQSYASAWKGFQMRECDPVPVPPYEEPPPTPPELPATDYPSDRGLTYVATNGDARPAYLTPDLTDSTWGNEVRRITNTTNYRNLYPKQQVENADGTRLFLGYGFRMLNASTYSDYGDSARPFGAEYPIWSNVNPDYMWGCSDNSPYLKRWSVSGGSWTNLYTIAGTGHVSIGNYEGNISDDDSRIALIYNTSTGGAGTWGVKVINTVTGFTVATLAIGTGAASQPNNVSISRSGAYVMIQHGASGSGTNQGTRMYDSATLTNLRLITADRAHGDMGKNAAGEDIYVHLSDGLVRSSRCSDGTSIQLLPSSYSVGHVSCTNYDRPGWAYLSSNISNTSIGNGQVFAVKTDGSQLVEVFCFHHNGGELTYQCTPFASASRDGTKVFFGGAWGGNSSTQNYGFVTAKVLA